MNILLFGATGMLGQGVLRACLLDPGVARVTVIGRTPCGRSDARLREIIVPDLFDVDAIEAGLGDFDACFFCLGVSAAGLDERAYTRLTHDLTLAIATVLARRNPQSTFIYVSGSGTDSSERGTSMWARVKGRTENALRRLPFRAVYLMRPGAIEPLHGARSKTRLYRLTYQFGAPLLPLLRHFWPQHILSTDIIAQAMLTLARDGAAQAVLESPDIYALTRPALPEAVPAPARSRVRGRRWLFAGLVVLALGALAGLLLGGCAAFGQLPAGRELTALEASPQWHDGHFVNPEPVWINLRSALSRLGETDPGVKPSAAAPVAVVHPVAAAFSHAPASGLRVTWFGHSSALIEIDGTTVLTDPIWSEIASPVNWAGPRRWYAPLLALADLPPIDVVVVSHDHYDHLDRATILALNNGHTRFVVPLGVGAHLRSWGVPAAQVVELDWWQSTTAGSLRVTATPARHSSGRVVPSTDKTLWAGFALSGPVHRAYFSGDTGFFPKLAEIGTRLGPFDVALIEAGQYDPDWPDLHLGPEQAVAASRMVGARTLIPVHWALFALAHHAWSEPAERSVRAAVCAGVQLLVPRPGASVEPAMPGPLVHWWPTPPADAPQRVVVATRHGDPAERVARSGCPLDAVAAVDGRAAVSAASHAR